VCPYTAGVPEWLSLNRVKDHPFFITNFVPTQPRGSGGVFMGVSPPKNTPPHPFPFAPSPPPWAYAPGERGLRLKSTLGLPVSMLRLEQMYDGCAGLSIPARKEIDDGRNPKT